jgi:formate hydrogenlyase subunit 4
MIERIVSLVAVLLLAPLVPGIAFRTRAFLTGRRGAPVLQLYRDLAKLLRRGTVYSTTTTVLFRIAPVALAATALTAALLVPLDGETAILRFAGDVLGFAYLLALGRFLLVLGALDTGSSFEGMGASREATFASLVELGLFFCFAAVGVATGELSLSGMFGVASGEPAPLAGPALVMVGVSLFGLLLAEAARVPVDDPATHLELTMIHEVMILDHSGPDLALLLYSSALKLALIGSLVVSLVLPRAGLPLPLWLLEQSAGLIGIGVAIGVVESSMARLRLTRVPLYIVGAAALAGFSLMLVLG